MKTLLILASFISFIGFSQNWDLINTNRTVFFQHSDSTHITNTIVIDSSLVNGVNTNYYTGYALKNCDTCQGYISSHPLLYRYACEFLGFEIIKDAQNNLFKLDTNTIKQHSLVNDTWNFNTSITATTVSITEQQILNITDSIKTIVLSTNDTIIISKNFGIIRYPTLTNPTEHLKLVGYHEDQVSYGEFLPNFWRVFDFEIGDIFCYEVSYPNLYIEPNSFNIQIKILNKTVENDKYIYEVANNTNNSSYSTFQTLEVQNSKYHPSNFYGLASKPNTDKSSNLYTYPFAQNFQNKLYSTFYHVSYYESELFGTVKYFKKYLLYSNDILSENEMPFGSRYSNNLGRIGQYDGLNIKNTYIDHLTGAITQGDTIGTLLNYNYALEDSIPTTQFEGLIMYDLFFYPNPATSEINLIKKYNHISIYNSIGQLVHEQQTPSLTIPIENLGSGVYIVKAYDANVHISKLVVE